MDLLQEHFNFWLEEMAQHKGKEFNEPFCHFILSINIHHFLHLKDEMEEVVSLRAHSKKHTAPHLDNELKELINHLWSAEMNAWRPGRNEGFRAVDDFAKGLEVLKKDKIKNFIVRTTTYLDILGLHKTSPTVLPTEQFEHEGKGEWGPSKHDELPSGTLPPPQLVAINRELCVRNFSQFSSQMKSVEQLTNYSL
jgi:hypothetical protein